MRVSWKLFHCATAEKIATVARIGVMPDPLPPEAPVARVTLSREAIVTARALMIAITGQAKRDVLEAAIAEGASSPYPVGRILADVELPLDVHWAP